ncbi:hypothetical protein C8R47DRAFT_1146708 [Mycena vitilis]|nr:hypothetical protein C8R47DRAFT_1152774 [Mycena vitilis]KAJ6472157.1 hypothetical protein C8R47DRAFT_1146708 [Mycena vitilis]
MEDHDMELFAYLLLASIFAVAAHYACQDPADIDLGASNQLPPSVDSAGQGGRSLPSTQARYPPPQRQGCPGDSAHGSPQSQPQPDTPAREPGGETDPSSSAGKQQFAPPIGAPNDVALGCYPPPQGHPSTSGGYEAAQQG